MSGVYDNYISNIVYYDKTSDLHGFMYTIFKYLCIYIHKNIQQVHILSGIHWFKCVCDGDRMQKYSEHQTDKYHKWKYLHRHNKDISLGADHSELSVGFTEFECLLSLYLRCFHWMTMCTIT